MCQQTSIVAADERCSRDDNQMFQGTCAEAAVGFFQGECVQRDCCYKTVCVQADSVAAAALGGLITSEMS